MKTFEFYLNFSIPFTDWDTEVDGFCDLLYGGGCNDSIIFIGKEGTLLLEFDREAENIVQAVGSAVHDVKQALPMATFVEGSVS